MKVAGQTQRVFITPRLVEDSLASAPSAIKLYDRSGEKEFTIGGDEVHFDPGSAAVTILDHKTQKQRKAVTEDLVRFVCLTDCLEHLDFQSTGLISGDVPDVVSDSYRLFIGLQFSAKEEVERLLKDNPPSLLEKDILHEVQNIMLSDAKKNGINSLPEINMP